MINMNRNAMIGAGAAALLLAMFGGPGVARAQEIKVDLDFDIEISQTDPHPVTYKYLDEVRPVREPGTDFYTFFYTGTVGPDARVDQSQVIQRIAISNSQWTKNRDWLINKLTLFYQVKNNQTPTALEDLTNQPLPENLRTGGALNVGGEGPAAVAPIPQFGGGGGGGGAPLFFSGGGGAPLLFNSGGGGAAGGAIAFDARAAAEWTFYYDQLVLWQYYCTRELLNDLSGSLLDAQAAAGELLQQTAGSPPNAPSAGGLRGGGGGGGPLGPPGSGGGFGAVAVVDPNQVTARETFSPVEDYNDPLSNLQYREKYVEAGQSLERNLYGLFIAMLNEIEQRDLNRQRYDEWLARKREDVIKFAEDWRNVESGKTIMIDNTLFLVTPQPLPVTPNSAINIIEKGRLTPQDLLDPDGTVRKPQVR